MLKTVISSGKSALFFSCCYTVITHTTPIIQENIHKNISYLREEQNTGEALYDLNGVLLNGKHFDLQRSQKFAIYENYTRIVIINSVNKEQPTNSAFNGRGTGFFVEVNDKEAYIITNYHVISRAIKNEGTNLEVLTAEDYWTYDGEVVGYDQVSDIGVIKITKQDNEEWNS